MSDYEMDDTLDFEVSDDPEVLRAALDFIEACEASDASDSSHEDATLQAALDHDKDVAATAEAAAEAAAAPAKPRSVTRNRRKEEIAELRQLVTKLENQLAGTKRKFQLPETLPFAIEGDGINAAAALPGAPVDVNVVWQQISQRQQQQRRLAEVENVNLRNQVLDQLRIARELTQVAKRRALMEDRIEAISRSVGGGSMSPTVGGINESPLLVTIYPSRPNMPTRVGVSLPFAAPASSTGSLLDDLQDQAMEGTSVGDVWKGAAFHEVVRAERTQAMRVAWQTLLRQLLSKRRAGFCHERLEDVIESAIAPTDSKVESGGLDSRLVYSGRYTNGHNEATPPFSWRPSGIWQSPAALLSALFASPSQKSISLRLFHQHKPSASLFDDDCAIDAPSHRRPLVSRTNCASRALQSWRQRSVLPSLHASSCF